MPIARFEMPDGRIAKFEVPEGTTPEQAHAMVSDFMAKPEPIKIGREAFGDALKEVIAEQNPFTAGLAQAGNTALKFARGLKQMLPQSKTLSDLGAPQAYKGSAKDTIFGMKGQELDALDAEIQNQFPVAHAVGDIGAQVGLTYLGAKALPLKALAGKAPALANPYVANAAAGAALGAGQVGSVEERAQGATLGAAGGAAGTLAGRAIPAAYNGVKGIVEPFTHGGQENIVGRTLQRFAVDPSRVEAAGAYSSLVPGVKPTLAEAALDPGISNLQRQFAVGTADQQLANNAARVNALRGIGGSEAQLAAANKARSDATWALYDQATQAVVKGDDALTEILARPATKKAMAKAQEIAGNKGVSITFGQNAPAQTIASSIVDPITGLPTTRNIPAQFKDFSGEGLHYVKLAIDDMLENPKANGIGKNEASALMALKNDLVGWIDGKIPEYGQARQAFQALSKPVNSMEVGNEIIKKSTSAAEDALGNPTLRNESLSRSVRDGDAIAQRVTGFNKATLGSTLDSTAKQTLSDVRRDLARKTAAENLGRATGSPTAQNLAAQNVMRQIAGPLGAPAGFAEANIWPTLLRPVNWAMKAQDPKIEAKLIEALQDPKLAAELIKRKAARPITGGLLGPVENYAVPAIASGLLNGRQ